MTDETALLIYYSYLILIPLEFACSKEDDCNGRGICNNLGNCECDAGWTGYLDCTFCKLINVSKNESQSH